MARTEEMVLQPKGIALAPRQTAIIVGLAYLGHYCVCVDVGSFCGVSR
jgi:hypothetical protein